MRTTTHLLTMLVLALPATGRAQPKTASADSAQIVRLEDGWASALVKRDKQYFARNLGRGFVYTEDANTATRDEVLRDIVTSQDTASAARNEAMTIHLFGTSTAVV